MKSVPWSLAQRVSTDFSTILNFVSMVIVLFMTQITWLMSKIVIQTEYGYLIGCATIVAVAQVPYGMATRPILFAMGRAL